AGADQLAAPDPARPPPPTDRWLGEGGAYVGFVDPHDEALGVGLRMEPLGDDSLVVVGQAGGILAGRKAVAYGEVAEHPLVGLDPDSSLRRWIEMRLGPRAPVARYRTTVAHINVLIALAAAGIGLAVVPRRALDPDQPLDVCELRDPWARRRHLRAAGRPPPPPAPAPHPQPRRRAPPPHGDG
ncbi:LysR substrate-binding domain-containing protein, partial [Streptomyces sp. NPDC059096]|uniref:LysR substrate-binding domain-containing protein n=1 Tax=Streptomyces sp. NPDC059096 TaxID=3346727 RepID=UPI003696AADC